MSNIVKEIVFPLDRNYSILHNSYNNENPIDVLYAYITFKELKRLVKVSRKHNVKVTIHDDMSIYPNAIGTMVKPKAMYHGSDWAEVYMPETYTAVTYEWLLEQVKAVGKGPKYTDYCLLDDDRLVVLGTEVSLEGRSDTSPNALIGGLTKTVQDLPNNYGIPPVWDYFTDFITINKENTYKVTLPDEAKLLIAEMRLQGMQDTAVYRVLQGISDAVHSLEKSTI